jgi:hypothetical protein
MAEISVSYDATKWADLKVIGGDVSGFVAAVVAAESDVDAGSLQTVIEAAVAGTTESSVAFLLLWDPIRPLVTARVDVGFIGPDAPTVASEAGGLDNKDSILHSVVALSDGTTAIRSAQFPPLGELLPEYADDTEQPLLAALRYRKDIQQGEDVHAIASLTLLTDRFELIPTLDPLLLDLLAGVSLTEATSDEAL